MRLGKGLVRLRKIRKLTQKEVATQLHVDATNYSRWEKDKSVPSLNTIESIADLFGVTLDELFEYTQKKENRDSSLNIALARLQEMKLKYIYDQEEDIVTIRISGDDYDVYAKDLPALIASTDKRYDNMVNDIYSSVYGTALAIVIKNNEFNKYVKAGKQAESILIKNWFKKRIKDNFNYIKDGYITKEMILDDKELVAKFVLIESFKREEIWNDIVTWLRKTNKINNDEYEADPEKWDCPFLSNYELFMIP